MYWQQQADYEIAVELDDENQTISGVEKITYHNNSKDGNDRRSMDPFRVDSYDDDIKEEDLDPALTLDIYSLLYTANLFSPGFLFSASSTLTYVCSALGVQ